MRKFVVVNVDFSNHDRGFKRAVKCTNELYTYYCSVDMGVPARVLPVPCKRECSTEEIRYSCLRNLRSFFGISSGFFSSLYIYIRIIIYSTLPCNAHNLYAGHNVQPAAMGNSFENALFLDFSSLYVVDN